MKEDCLSISRESADSCAVAKDLPMLLQMDNGVSYSWLETLTLSPSPEPKTKIQNDWTPFTGSPPTIKYLTDLDDGRPYCPILLLFPTSQDEIEYCFPSHWLSKMD